MLTPLTHFAFMVFVCVLELRSELAFWYDCLIFCSVLDLRFEFGLSLVFSDIVPESLSGSVGHRASCLEIGCSCVLVAFWVRFGCVVELLRVYVQLHSRLDAPTQWLTSLGCPCAASTLDLTLC